MIWRVLLGIGILSLFLDEGRSYSFKCMIGAVLAFLFYELRKLQEELKKTKDYVSETITSQQKKQENQRIAFSIEFDKVIQRLKILEATLAQHGAEHSETVASKTPPIDIETRFSKNVSETVEETIAVPSINTSTLEESQSSKASLNRFSHSPIRVQTDILKPPVASVLEPAESRLKKTEVKITSEPPVVTQPPKINSALQAKPHPSAHIRQPDHSYVPMNSEPSWLELVWQKWVLGGNPMVKIGVLLLFLGLAFLLRYAAEHAVLPVELRYAVVALSGIALLVVGWKRRDREDSYGLILQGTGIGVMYLVTLAAMRLHPLIPLSLGFAILLSVAILSSMLAVLQNSLAFAIAGALGGFAAPVLTSSGSDRPVAFFLYLTLLNLGIVAIAWFKAWRPLNLVGFISTFVLGSAWASQYYHPELYTKTQPFVLLFMMYVYITFLFAQRTLAYLEHEDITKVTLREQMRYVAEHTDYVDSFLLFGVPIASFSWQYLLVKGSAYGAAFSALGFGFFYILLAFLVVQQNGKRYALLTEALIASGVLFGTLAIPLGLEQQWTSAAWAIEAAGMYWIGIRQKKPHARLFALLLLIGAAFIAIVKLHWINDSTVLAGSWLGAVLLSVSSMVIIKQMRETGLTTLHTIEQNLYKTILSSAIVFVSSIPFIVLPMQWATAVLSVIGTALVGLAFWLPELFLLYWGGCLPLLAGILFLTTLHAGHETSVFANGWSGLLTMAIMSASFLSGVWQYVRYYGEREKNNGSISLGIVGTLGLLAGLIFINLAPLTVLPWRFSLMIWPVTGLGMLWWAMRMRLPVAIFFAIGLQVLSGLIYLLISPVVPVYALSVQPPDDFLQNSRFWGSIVIALAAFICAYLLHRAHRKELLFDAKFFVWSALGWSGLWWRFAWHDEVIRHVSALHQTASLVGVTLVTIAACSHLARRKKWDELGQATLCYLPLLVLILAEAVLHSNEYHPLKGWGSIAWGLALIVHVFIIYRQTSWVKKDNLGYFHVLGVWLFMCVGALELRWLFAQLGHTGSAWPLLGWMIIPSAYLGLVIQPAIQKHWPVRSFQYFYLKVAAVPVVIYLLAWIWITSSFNDGTALPLPYVPVINPLEIAYLVVMLSIIFWWQQISNSESSNRQPDRLQAIIVAGSTGFIVLTGMIVRTCHHWAGIPWNFSELFHSLLVQTSLSIVWSSVAITLMVSVNRHRLRWVWIMGAVLMAVVVVKLFLIELAASGSLARIVSFIAVGLLLLIVGYIAPLPPKDTSRTDF